MSWWRLKADVQNQISARLGLFTVDPVTARLDHQLPRSFSSRLNPKAVTTDVFLQDWNKEQRDAISSFSMIMQVSAQVRRQQAELVPVTPVWIAQVWYLFLMEYSWDSLIRLLLLPDLRLDTSGNPHGLKIKDTVFTGMEDYKERWKVPVLSYHTQSLLCKG